MMSKNEKGVCFRCAQRAAGCHSRCARYLAEREKAEGEKAALEQERILSGYKLRICNRYKKKGKTL